MPKKDTGFTPTGRQKKSSLVKQTTPMKAPVNKAPELPTSIPNKVAPTKAVGYISRPAPLKPRTPRI